MLNTTEFNPEKVDTLLLNGTDTWYTPEHYCPAFPIATAGDKKNRSETISFLATCIDKYQNESKAESIAPILDTETKNVFDGTKFVRLERPLNIKLIEGPNTSGNNTHEKIALAVASRLGADLEGKNIFNIGGHSRGAVEAILVAWELQRIKDAMQATDEATTHQQIFQIICGNPHEPGICSSAKKVREKLSEILLPICENADALNLIREKFRYKDENQFNPETSEIVVNLFLIDPVPGNAILRLGSMIGWTDPNMFKYPPIVRHVTKICCRNEDSACFDLLHTEPGTNTILSNHVMPGHHGTPTGNPFGNNGESLQSLGVQEDLHAEDAQLMTMYMAIDFFTRNGSLCKETNENPFPLSEKYNEYMKASAKERDQIRLETYWRIHKNIEAYNALNKTVYISLGWPWHESFDFPFEKTSKTRPMIKDAQNNKCSMGEVMPFNSRFFINQDHLKLFLQVHIGLDPNLLPDEQMSRLLENSEDPVYSKINDETGQDILPFIEEAINNNISALIQEYIKNNLDSTRKSNIIKTINTALNFEIPNDDFHYVRDLAETKSEEDRNYTNLGKIKNNLKKTLKTNLKLQIELQVKAYHDGLEDMIKGMHKYDSSTESLNQIIYVQALDKYQQLSTFANHLSELRSNIENSEDFKEILEEKINTVKDYATLLPPLIAKLLIEKGTELPVIDVDESGEANEICTKFYNQTKENYNCQTGGFAKLTKDYETLRVRLNQNTEDYETLRNRLNANKDNINQLKAIHTFKYCNMQILSGFIFAIGSLAVAAAFTVLALHALGVFASAGIGASGLAFLAFGIFTHRKHVKLEAFKESLAIIEPQQQATGL